MLIGIQTRLDNNVFTMFLNQDGDDDSVLSDSDDRDSHKFCYGK